MDILSFESQAIYAADMVVEMDKGRVKWLGTPSDLNVSSYLAFPSIDNCSVSSEIQAEERSSFAIEAKEEVQEDDSGYLNGVHGTIEAETRKEGRVELVVYK